MRKFFIGLFGGAGVLHFLKPEPFDSIVPPSLPGSQRTYTLVSGAAELAVAGALLGKGSVRRLGTRAAAVLLAAVWPGNIYMAWDWQQSHRPAWQKIGAWARVPLQIPLIAWVLREDKDR